MSKFGKPSANKKPSAGSKKVLEKRLKELELAILLSQISPNIYSLLLQNIEEMKHIIGLQPNTDA